MSEKNSLRSARLVLACLGLLVGFGVEAQAQLRITPVQPDQIGNAINCYVGGSSHQLIPDKQLIHRATPLAFAPSNIETQKLFDTISRHTELRINIYTVPVTNADVSVEICPSDGGRNYIAYSPAWLQKIYDETKNPWVLYAVIAHEVGHYDLNHDRKSLGSTREVELEADEFAGRILALMDASLPDAKAAYESEVMIPWRTRTHPAAAERLVAVQRGWEKGRAGNPQYSYALRGTIQYLPHGSNTLTTYRVNETTAEHALPRFKNLYGRFQSVDLDVTQFTNGNRCASGTMGNSPHQHMHPPGLADDRDGLEVHINKLSVGNRGTPGPYFKGGWQGRVIDGGTSGSMYMEIFLEPSTACDGR